MPRTPIDYKKAVIYMIVCKTNSSLLYIGSTTDFRKRKNSHKGKCNNDKFKAYNFQVYVMIRANGGWDAFDMKPVKEFPCENKIQLLIEEERIRTEMNANLNANRSMTSTDDKKEQIKEYHQQHKEQIAEQMKEYYQQHKEPIAEQQKEYRQQNKEQIAERKRQYYLLNRDKINQQRREKRKKLS